MKTSDLRPINTLVQKFGVKCLTYGGPGSGKTPIANTAPNPVMCVIEPGILSMKKYSIPAWESYTASRIDEFFQWLKLSNETKNFDTIAIDSVSQMCETILSDELPRHKDPRAAYGMMAKRVMDYINFLYFLPNKHIYLICKLETSEDAGAKKFHPYFPGKELNTKIPHLFDEIFFVGKHTIPGVGQHVAFRTRESFDSVGRDRSGTLDEFEQTILTGVFSKIMQG